MTLFLAPMQLSGAVLGVLIQQILPNWLYLLIAAVILGYIAYKTYTKWWDAREKERKAHEAGQQQQEAQDASSIDSPSKNSAQEDNTPLGNDNMDPEEQAMDATSSSVELSCSIVDLEATNKKDHNANDNEEDAPKEQVDDILDLSAVDAEKIARRDYLLEQDARQYPTEKIMVFFVLFIGLTLLTLFQGGKGVDSIVGITCESAWYGVVIALQFLWTLGFAAYFGWKLTKDTQEKQTVGYPFHPQDVLWDFRNTKFYAFFSFVAGIVAGLIGIGGGMILGPLMLVMGIDPRVSAASNATMIVLTSSSVAVLYVTSGLVPWQYAVCFFCTCFAGAYIGKKYIDGYIKRSGKASILIFWLATIITFATIGTLVIVFTRLADVNWCFAGMNQFCKVSSEDDEVECVSSVGERMLMMHGSNFYVDVIGGAAK
jgi:uncharacterized membrane protein YfcA